MLREWSPQPGSSPLCWVPVCLIPMNSRQSHEEGPTINLLDPMGTWEVREAESLAPVYTDDWSGQD